MFSLCIKDKWKYIEIWQNILRFGNLEIEKRRFHYFKEPISIDEKNSKILISDKVSCGKKRSKGFVWYKDDKFIGPLSTVLPKMKAHMKCFEESNCISFLVNDEDLLGKCNEYGMKKSIANFHEIQLPFIHWVT